MRIFVALCIGFIIFGVSASPKFLGVSWAVADISITGGSDAIDPVEQRRYSEFDPVQQARYSTFEQAIKNDRHKDVKAMIDIGIDVNVKPPVPDFEAMRGVHGWVFYKSWSDPTFLMLAAMYSTPEMLSILLDAGANVNARSRFGDTALMMVFGEVHLQHHPSGHPRLECEGIYFKMNRHNSVKVLLEAGADISISTPAGHTALMVAAAVGDDKSVRLLIEAGANSTRRDKGGRSAYNTAMLCRHWDVAELLRP